MGLTPQNPIDHDLWDVLGPSTSLFNIDGTISNPSMYIKDKGTSGTCPFVSTLDGRNSSYTNSLYPLIESALTQLRRGVQELPSEVKQGLNPLEYMLLTEGLALGLNQAQLQVHLADHMRKNNMPHLSRWKNIAYPEDPNVKYV